MAETEVVMDQSHRWQCLVVLVGLLLVLQPIGVGAVLGTGGPSDSTDHNATPTQNLSVTQNATSAATVATQGAHVQQLTNETPRSSPTGAATGVTTAADRQTVVLELINESEHLQTNVRQYNVTVQSMYGKHVQIRAPTEQIAILKTKSWVRDVRPPRRGEPTTVSEGVNAIGADQVHDQLNVRGGGVKVGVLSVSGFNTGNPEIAGNTAATRSFTGDITNRGQNKHGTGVAEIVADTAPQSDLYLANFQTGVEYANAVDWMREQDVDVIVMSVSFFHQPYDGSGFTSQVATRATDDGIIWVNSAGNYAEQHWQGQYRDADNDHWMEFSGVDEGNSLANGRQLQAGERVQISLNWDAWEDRDTDYDLYLFRETTDGNNELIAVENRVQNGNAEPWEALQLRVPESGRYFVAVRAASTPHATSLELFVRDGGPPGYTVAAGSVTAPAVAHNVTSTGAFRHDTGELEPFSSHGPTNDGRIGVDVVAPDGVQTTAYDGSFYGTSAAAPHAAGVVALMLSADPTQSPSEIRTTLRETATDREGGGVNTATGYGWINAADAVTASQANQLPPIAGFDTHPTDPDNDGVYEDINGDGQVDITDVQAFFRYREDTIIQEHSTAFDFTGDGEVDIVDVQRLYVETT